MATKTLQIAKIRHLNRWLMLVCLVLSGVVSSVVIGYPKKPASGRPSITKTLSYQEKKPVDTGGFTAVLPTLDRWPSDGVVRGDRPRLQGRRVPQHREDRSPAWPRPGSPKIAGSSSSWPRRRCLTTRPTPARAYEVLQKVRTWLGERDKLAEQWLYTVILFPGSDRASPGRERQLHHVPGRKLVHPADLQGGRAHEAPWLEAGDQAFHRVPRPGFPKTSKPNGC